MIDPIIRSVSLAPTVRQLRRASIQAVGEVAPVALDIPAKPAPAPIKEQVPLTQAFVAAHAPLAQNDDSEARRERERKELQELRERTEDEAYKLGLEKGQREAKEAVAQYIQQLQTLTAELNKAKAAAAQQAEDGIVAVVYEACCKMIGATALTRDGVAAQVNLALSAFNDESGVLVRLHPHDLSVLQAAMPEINAKGDVRWQEDATITLGGCVVEGASGTLDARLETQLAGLRTTLLTARKNKSLPKDID